jgi:O-antigen ligase
MIERATANGRLFWTVPLPDHAQPFGPYVNRNHFAGLLAPLLPFAVAALIDRWRRLRREMSARALLGAVARGAELAVPLLAVAVFLLGTATVLSASRGGILAAAVGLAALGALYGRGAGRSRRRGVVFLSVPLFLGTAWLGVPRAGERFLSQGAGDRLRVWAEALPMFRDHPVVGIGAGAFGDVFPLYRVSAGPHPVRFAHAENEALELLVETGVVGVALLGAALFLLLARAFRARRAGPVPWTVPGALAALAAALAHALVDFNLHVPGNALLYTALAALLWAATAAASPRPEGAASSSTSDRASPGG